MPVSFAYKTNHPTKMMLGEQHRPNTTVTVPPWTLIDDSSPEIHSPSPLTNAVISDYNTYYFHEALTALQRYLPCNESELDGSDSDLSGLDNPDSPVVDAYSCDQFRMYEFKVRRCARGRSHDWTECPYAHPGEKARRRDPRKYHYSGTACPDFRKGNCKKGDACEYAHGVFECWLHPARYRTQPCKDGPQCRRRVCFFAHTPEQLRVLPQSPKEASGAKSLSFFSSSPSGSVSPPTEECSSPPMSPMTANSINEMVASFRGLQLGKVKSLPSSWNVQVGGGSGFGSPRGPIMRPGFSSLPTTPTRVPTRSGLGFVDFWDRVCEEEVPMERVESGRDLRAKMFERLTKENFSGRVDLDPGQSAGGPDVGWVSELVK